MVAGKRRHVYVELNFMEIAVDYVEVTERRPTDRLSRNLVSCLYI
jgi:hypothetical protein